MWRHGVTGAQELQVDLGKRLLGDAVLSPQGAVVAVRLIEDDGAASSLQIHARSGTVTHRFYEPDWCVLPPSFAGENKLVVTRMRRDSTAREVNLVDLNSEKVATLVREESRKGFVPLPPAISSGSAAAYLRYVDGWPLLCVCDLSSGEETVINPGPHEDLTDVHDLPAFSPNGRHIAYNSSAADLRERHLYVYDLEKATVARRSFAVGATSAKAWLDDGQLLFVESQEREGSALRWLNLNGADTGSLTIAVGARSRAGVSPRPIVLKGPEADIPADLYLPPGSSAGRPRPAVVYAHGGIFRQLTRGYPPSFAYTLLHEINLGLLRLGFTVLSVEYRGSMGFGLEHDQANFMRSGMVDAADCALGAEYLASLPEVDPNRIGIWGLSWGGTMTLNALGQHPDSFAAGVNLAGIWDFEQRARYWNALQAGQPIYFNGRMGSPGNVARRRASAREKADRLRAPLLAVHGTADEAVDYEQLTLLKADAQQLSLDVETLTLEGESHVFGSAESWRRVVPAILGFMLRHLGPTGGEGE